MAEQKYINIYGLCGIDGIVRYIGYTSKKLSYRLSNHIYESKKENIYNRRVLWLNSENIYDIKIILIDKVLMEDVIFWEKYWISQFKTWGFDLVNSNNGGGGMVKRGEGFSEWLSERNIGNKNMLGKKHSFKSKKIMSEKRKGVVNINKGKKLPKDWVDNLKGKREINKKYFRNCPKCGIEIGYSTIYLLNKGKEEKTLCRSCFTTGRVLSDETKNKMSNSMKGTSKSDTSNMGKNKITIIQKDLDGNNIKEWESIIKAESELQIFGITKVCKGYRKTAGKFKWEYKDE